MLVKSRHTLTNGSVSNMNGSSYTASTTEGLSGRRMRKYCLVEASPVRGTTRTCGPDILARCRHSAIRLRVSCKAGDLLSIFSRGGASRDIGHDELAVSLNNGAILEVDSSG